MLKSFGLDRRALAAYRRLLAYVVPHWRMFSLAILGMIAYAATQPGFAALMKPLMDQSFVRRNPTTIKILPVVVVGLFALRGFAGFASTYCLNWVGRRVIKRLRSQVFARLLSLPAGYYDQTSSGMLISKLTYNIEQVAESTTNVVTVIIRDGLTVIGLVAWMFYLSPILSIFMVVIGPIIALLVRYVSARFRGYSSRIQDSMGDVTKVAEEVINGHRAVKVFGGEEQETHHFEVVNEHNRRLNMKLVTTNATSSPVIQLIAGIGMAGVLYVATLPAMLNAITVGTFVSFVGAMLLVMAPLKHLTDVNAPLQKGIAAGASIFDLLDMSPEPPGGALRLTRVRGALSYRDVHFAYTPAKGEVLSGINFTVEPGETIAIVGRSGSGKSTLASLLPRFYDPRSGVVTVDGHDIRDYRLPDLRRQIALVSQDVVLFNTSIARNIAYGGREGASGEELRAAAEAAHALEFIQRLPHGFDTVIGDRGVLLSGGQRQRIAIARALLKNAPILILDEATSALDTQAEQHIQAALESLMRQRTTLVIAHRLSTVERADRIVVLERGRIVESGRHAELIARAGYYAALHRVQFKDAAMA